MCGVHKSAFHTETSTRASASTEL